MGLADKPEFSPVYNATDTQTRWRRYGRWLIASLMLFSLWASSSAPVWAQDFNPAQDASSIQPYIDRVANEVTEFTLDNGMKFIVLERHEAPVVSFMLYANVGAASEEDGKTGVAHYLEHLAFKGTTQIGTRNYAAEAPVLERLDALFAQLMTAEKAGDKALAEDLRSQFEAVRAEAASYVEQNKFGQIIEQAGGRGLNATTSADATRYFYSLPSNKLELWMSLESERFLDPVFREFYEEKEVILEERRMRVDNSPIGQMVEKFLEVSFDEHPYRRPVIGYEDDLRLATRDDITEFFNTYYGPSNLIATIVGDVDPANVQQLAAAYFGRYTARSAAPTVDIVEPAQTEPKTFTLSLPTQPWYLEGYHRPGINDPDSLIYRMIDGVLLSGRTSRLYQTLVEDAQVALDVGSADTFPGDRYANVVLFYALTAPGHTVDEVATLLNAELERLKAEPVTAEELERVKTQARASLLRALSSNSGMASLLAEYEAKTGSWQTIFEDLQAIDQITAQDVQRVAQATFQPNNRTVGKLLSADPTE
ncbi:MAG: pitrilysin family protein [Cyanobacteria bacterium P01_D01_bin.14]